LKTVYKISILKIKIKHTLTIQYFYYYFKGGESKTYKPKQTHYQEIKGKVRKEEKGKEWK